MLESGALVGTVEYGDNERLSSLKPSHARNEARRRIVV